MCGYAQRKISKEQLAVIADRLGFPGGLATQDDGEVSRYYPAFGGAASRTLDLVIGGEAGKRVVDATWWFDCQMDDGTLRVNNQRTTFNARNLASPYWRGAIRHSRGVFLVSGIGEGKVIDGKNRHFLVESDEPILLGCVYRAFPNGCYSAAIITRDSHSRFEPYHDKAFPLMLPHDREFIDLWLSDAQEGVPQIADLLACPRIFNDLEITPVKTFKGAMATGEMIRLGRDL